MHVGKICKLMCDVIVAGQGRLEEIRYLNWQCAEEKKYTSQALSLQSVLLELLGLISARPALLTSSGVRTRLFVFPREHLNHFLSRFARWENFFCRVSVFQKVKTKLKAASRSTTPSESEVFSLSLLPNLMPSELSLFCCVTLYSLTDLQKQAT